MKVAKILADIMHVLSLCLTPGVLPCDNPPAVHSADGALMFQQVPMVEIDGMKLVQTKAILNYIAEKYNLHGKDLKDRVMYDTPIYQYNEGSVYCIQLFFSR